LVFSDRSFEALMGDPMLLDKRVKLRHVFLRLWLPCWLPTEGEGEALWREVLENHGAG
jgi:hypothetical protein